MARLLYMAITSLDGHVADEAARRPCPAMSGHVRLLLELLNERRFGGGVVHLGYRVVNREHIA